MWRSIASFPTLWTDVKPLLLNGATGDMVEVKTVVRAQDACAKDGLLPPTINGKLCRLLSLLAL